MKVFIDTANIEEIGKANDMGVICGVTTNPSLIAKEGRDFIEVVKEIAAIIDGPINKVVVNIVIHSFLMFATENRAYRKCGMLYLVLQMKYYGVRKARK